ncbi:DMT family transporter [Rhizobacter sp. SG703]|uniref:DMT family transporter n=1 Tax=Rhizobacter sp. SG703 TaxID=2587140 RepID=UPI001446DAAA|nr:DMT family transporter [Rhizobacter sp. SG703]NKI92374.1 drug/metabolite transporter (DMT)-like permease [Rhizobacter sp. SG703]
MTLPRSPAVGIAGLLLATTAWGSLFLASKPVLPHVDPVWFTLLRYSIATLGFMAVLRLRGPVPWSALRQHGARLAGLGFIGYGVFSAMVLVGLAHSLPSHGAVIMATMPITTQLVRWALDGQRPSRSAVFSTLLALVGVAMVSGAVTRAASAQASTLVGDLTALAGTLGWIAYTRGAARFPALDVIGFSALSALASWPLLLIATLALTAFGLAPVPTAEAAWNAAPALVYIGLVPTVFGVLAYNFGVRTLGVVTSTAFLNVVPVSVLLIGVAMGSRPALHELAGVMLVVSGLLVHTLSQRAASRLAKDAQRPVPAGDIDRNALVCRSPRPLRLLSIARMRRSSS